MVPPMSSANPQFNISRYLCNNAKGSCCSTVEEHAPSDQPVVGSDHVVCWAFFSLGILSLSISLLSCESLKGPSRRCNTTGKGAEQCSMGRTKLIVHLVRYNYKNALRIFQTVAEY